MKTLLVTLLKTVTRPTFRLPCALGLTLLALMLAPAAWAASPETLTGSGNWTVPTGVTTVTVEMWGGGGGGGAKIATGTAARGSGGGGGGYTRATLTGLTGGSTIAYSVGGGGLAGLVSGSVAPSAGTNTTFVGVTTAGGGGAGKNKVDTTTPLTGGAGGTGLTASGGTGESWTSGQNAGAGAGAGGWSGSAGVVGGNGGSVTSGTGGVGGGTAPSKGGDGGTCVNATVGASGGSPGGGGAGGSATSANTINGGPGAAGTIILTYSVAGSPPSVTTPTSASVTNVSATLGANVVANSGATITDYGVVYAATSVNAAPTLGGTGVTKLQKSTTETLGVFTVSATGLTPGTQYSYAGYATNSSGNGYSSYGTFYALTNEPTGQASAVSFSSAQRSAFTLSWTRGTGEKCIVLVKAGVAVDAPPVDGTTYTASATFGSGTQIGTGNYVAYLGTGNSVTLSGLTASTNYNVAVYELNGAAGSENYLTTSPATGNQTATGNNYYSSGNNNPTTLANWFTGTGGTGSSPANFTGGDNFIIQSGHTLTATTPGWTVSGGAAVTINSGGKLDMATFPFKLGGSFANSGTFVSGSGVASVTFTASGTITPGVSAVGVVAQGGGGGGGGASAAGQGGGGGGGACAYSASVAVQGGTS